MSTPDFLEGCVPAGQFATSLGKTYRTIFRWMTEPDGLPYLQLGRDRYIHVSPRENGCLAVAHAGEPRRAVGADCATRIVPRPRGGVPSRPEIPKTPRGILVTSPLDA